MGPGPFIFSERPSSRQHKKLSYELNYIARNSEDVPFVRAFARQYAPQIIATAEGNVYQQDAEVVPRSKWIMDVRIPYGPKQNMAGALTWGASATGGTVHITHAREHIADFAPPGNVAPNHKGAINVETGEVKGADIIYPVSQRWIEFTHPLGMVTWAFADRMDNLVGCVNSKPFMGKKAGEVLVLAWNGEDGSNKEATVRTEFAISKNRQGFQVGDVVNIAKDGHDLLWIEFITNADAFPTKKIRAVHIERVFERVDLAAELGYGG